MSDPISRVPPIIPTVPVKPVQPSGDGRRQNDEESQTPGRDPEEVDHDDANDRTPEPDRSVDDDPQRPTIDEYI